MMRFFLPLLFIARCILAWSVCLDPGHGGSDNGAVGIYYTEKEANLDVAYLVRSYLEQLPECDIVAMTRLVDEYVSLADRVAYANAGGYDRFISIHHNAFNGSTQGTETYCYQDGFPESFDFRDITHPYILNAFGYIDRGVKTAGFYVIKYTNMPSILGEASFLDYIVQWNESWRLFTQWQDHEGIEGWAYCAGVCEHMLSPVTPSYLSRVVDNSYPLFSTEGPGQWDTGCFGVPFGPDYAWITVSDDINTGRWNPYIPVSGWYDISLWWVSGPNRTTDAKLTVHHHNGESNFTVDQSIGGEEWYKLGTFAFHEGTFGWVEISSEGCTPGQVIVADAVRFEIAPTGIEEDPPATEQAMHVSPNPAGASVRIELCGVSVLAEISIYNISGRLVQIIPSQYQQSNVFLWNPEGCEPGVYFAVAIGNESDVLSKRIILLGQ
ncbi:MAG: N-acetylmuramoyl-L-alanine amidase [Candidatus Aegiribacteria sp.]|nr:N-acetylmuramoyl-L-alanine amidase [Candidatus Aegiribacteria sp.]